MPEKFYTLDDLYDFCKTNNFSHFSIKESGAPIIVQSLGKFETSVESNQGLVPVTLQSCHTEKNRNRSYISEETMTKALPSFANKPILGYIHQLEDGSYDFYTHNISYVEDEDSEDGVRLEYDERPIGVIPESCNAHLEYDKEKDKTYVVVSGYIYEDYGNRAVDIIKNNNGQTKVSVEIAINEMSYNAKEDYLSIDDMYFMGVTCLGKTPDGEIVQEGMEGANLKLDNFSAAQNSMFYSNKIVDLLSNIDKKLDSLSNIKFNEKGVENEMNHFEELLAKYGKTVEDITFEYEDMSDEELDAKFAELFDEAGDAGDGSDGDAGVSETSDDGEESGEEGVAKISDEQDDVVAIDISEDEDGNDDDDNEDEIDNEAPGTKKKIENSIIKYELSHDDIRSALYSLLNAQDENGYYSCWIVEVYDDKFIYEDWKNASFYRQKYSKDGDNIAFNDEPVEVFNEWLSKEEKDALDALKADYAVLKSFKENYDAAQVKAEKDAILNSAEYTEIKELEEFQTLINDVEKYSVEELKVKADLIFAASMKKKFNFTADKPVQPHSVSFNINSKKDKKKKAYGGLFDK